MDQIIKLYSYGAIVDGEPILYAPKREKKPMTPVKPIVINIIKYEILGMLQLIRMKLYSNKLSGENVKLFIMR